MNRLRKKNVANMPSETENATTLPAVNAGIRKKESGIIAWGVRCSHTRNASEERAREHEAADDQRVGPARWFASIRAYVKAKSARCRAAGRHVELRASSEPDSRTVRMATANATMPIGTLRKNTDSQPRCSTM